MVFLGQASNYSAGQLWRHLLAWGTRRDFDMLRSELAQKYQADLRDVALYHTGRSALTAALKAVAPAGAAVIIPGLTCIAVVRAVRAAGCEPIFIDIKPENLEYDYQRLEQKLQELAAQQGKKLANSETGSRPKTQSHFPIDKNNKVCYNGSIVLVQNTLGYPWQVQKLEKIAQKYGAKLVEDLAHSAGRFYPDGREVGMVGAAVALSFGKGKAIDTISGGAAIVRKHQTEPVTQQDRQVEKTASKSSIPEADWLPVTSSLQQPTIKPRLADRLRDRWYPLFGGLSRVLWHVGLGRLLIGGLVKIDFVQRSADAELDLAHRLTYWQAKLALKQLRQLPTTPLREFRLVRDRAEVLSKLQQNGYYLSEIWYDTPVSPARYAKEANFPTDQCPQTMKIAKQIINLPTWYPEVKMAQALKIIEPYIIEDSVDSLNSEAARRAK